MVNKILILLVIYIFLPNILFAQNLEIKTVTIITKTDKVNIEAEIAKSLEQQTKGLMFRKEMPKNYGMLFIFEKEQPIAMWMKNTFIALDMIFLNKNYTIIKIAKYTKPQSLDLIYSKENTKYVLEVNAGFADYHNIKEGDKMIISK